MELTLSKNTDPKTHEHGWDCFRTSGGMTNAMEVGTPLVDRIETVYRTAHNTGYKNGHRAATAGVHDLLLCESKKLALQPASSTVSPWIRAVRTAGRWRKRLVSDQSSSANRSRELEADVIADAKEIVDDPQTFGARVSSIVSELLLVNESVNLRVQPLEVEKQGLLAELEAIKKAAMPILDHGSEGALTGDCVYCGVVMVGEDDSPPDHSSDCAFQQFADLVSPLKSRIEEVDPIEETNAAIEAGILDFG